MVAIALVGGLLSFPWFAAFLATIWFMPDVYWRNLLLTCTLGPLVICASWWTVFGTSLFETVVISSFSSSVVFFSVVSWNKRKTLAAID